MAVTVTSCKRYFDDSASTATDACSEQINFLILTQEEDLRPYQVAALAAYTVPVGDTGGNVDLPSFGLPHDINSQMLVTMRAAVRAKSDTGQYLKNGWVMTVTFSFPKSGGAGGLTDSSTNITVSVSGQEETQYTQRTKGSSPKAITNTLGDLLPPTEVTLYDEVINIRFRTFSLNMDGIADTRGKINSDTVTLSIPQGTITFSRTFAPRTLLLKCDYSVGVSTTNPEVHEWDVNLSLLYRKDTWLRKFPNQGYRYLDPVTDEEVGPKESPVALDISGYKQASGAEMVLTDPYQLNDDVAYAPLLAGL